MTGKVYFTYKKLRHKNKIWGCFVYINLRLDRKYSIILYINRYSVNITEVQQGKILMLLPNYDRNSWN